jgi:FixJ family two-component response regulator
MQPFSSVHIVEDDASVAASIEAAMMAQGYLVEVFSSAEHFLLNCDKERPGCLIVDVRLPGLSGLELQDALISRSIDIPIIFMSGHADADVRARVLSKGAVSFLEKPFAANKLFENVRKVFASPQE